LWYKKLGNVFRKRKSKEKFTVEGKKNSKNFPILFSRK
jgi:hypothetical protein